MANKKRPFLTSTATLAAAILIGSAGAADLDTPAIGSVADTGRPSLEQPAPDFVIAPAQPGGAQANDHYSHRSHSSHESHASHSSHESHYSSS